MLFGVFADQEMHEPEIDGSMICKSGSDARQYVVAVSTAPNVSSIAFAASAGANDNGNGCGDLEKPLDMMLEEELEMWKEKENDRH